MKVTEKEAFRNQIKQLEDLLDAQSSFIYLLRAKVDLGITTLQAVKSYLEDQPDGGVYVDVASQAIEKMYGRWPEAKHRTLEEKGRESNLEG